ncbi:xanthan lyase [Bacteroides sp. UBA939]|uniref:golvesin C-terminal-like domain-containing protein n=1 Tax=Bacteroides sp. UBA939 TaxID=1946092 RepID=UPI0025BC343A|nr:xanthan lyase [Bacteroides sp. UBA939]
MNVRLYFLFILFTASLIPQQGGAQELPTDVRQEIEKLLYATARKEISVGRIRVDSVAIQGNTLQLFANMNLAYTPFREDNVAELYREVKALLPAELSKYDLQIRTNKHSIEELIPQALRNKKDKKSKKNEKPQAFAPAGEKPLVTHLSVPYAPTNGLNNRHIAMWQSHGYYYEPKLTRWEWQRARVFQTVEDLYTQSYVLPFLVPMLENAGANVLTPRERDSQTKEVIVDNDGCLYGRSVYTENIGDKVWSQGAGEGFAHLRSQYIDFQNPFREGTFRTIETVKGKKDRESTAEWIPEIPATGQYAVYVSYKTLPNSTDDALYTIYHKGGSTQFKVNQQMGGGTWIYLGTFGFDAGKNNACKVVLSNRSDKAGRVVTADGVKIGGGMGNIARRISAEGATANVKSSEANAAVAHKEMPKIDYPYEVSGYPRFCEASRYWLQWAGFPDSVYTESRGKNDYTDDYKSRGIWVNYLAGGSATNPTEEGLNIPVDMAFAFHTDAGTTLNDSIIGTLGIYYTNVYNEEYANGASRFLAHDMTDLIQSNIVRDIRALYEPNWTRRGMWNQSYFEARVPRAPTMLLELLSHQNFADMRYGLDPRFRFTVSRSIYKGMLQFICSQYNTDYVVQPLPVDNMALRMAGDNEIELTWQPVADPQEPTANAEKYIVYTRIGDGDFDNGVLVDRNVYRAKLPAGMVCSYKVTAVNKGGESFPSEILSAGRAFNEKGTVLVVNGFDRISAPADFVAPAPGDTLLAGFLDELDHGVPYLKDISYIGKMKEFRRSIPWMDDDASGFGDSNTDYEDKVIAGNSFDYPAVHGSAILRAGYSFVSCSDETVENKTTNMNDYKYVDLILGKECQTKMGRGGVKPLEFKTFSNPMQEAIATYCGQGGNIFVSGAYVGTDLWDNRLAPAQLADKEFATEVLKYKWRVGQAATEGKVKCVASPFPAISGNYTYYSELNANSYVVESPDAIEPATKEAYTIMRYSENNRSAGVAYKGNYKTCVLGFPFEALRTVTEREALMNAILTFFNEDTNLSTK